jgi:hypothetical protein
MLITAVKVYMNFPLRNPNVYAHIIYIPVIIMLILILYTILKHYLSKEYFFKAKIIIIVDNLSRIISCINNHVICKLCKLVEINITFNILYTIIIAQEVMREYILPASDILQI